MVSRLTPTYTPGMENGQIRELLSCSWRHATPRQMQLRLPISYASTIKCDRSTSYQNLPNALTAWQLRRIEQVSSSGQFCSGTGTPDPFNCWWGLTRERLVAKKPKKLEDLFHETLKDIYFAENKILKTLPKMAKAAHSKRLSGKKLNPMNHL